MDIEQLIKTIQRKEKDVWSLGNDVLYKLCKDHPLHKTDDEIQAKIWLIGRAYAASIERRVKWLEIPNDEFYSTIVVPKIKKSDIDKWMEDCKSEKTTKSYLLAHKKITDLFEEMSGLEKRSLASKYLHFHLPDIFFIYDSRAVHSIGILFKELHLKVSKEENDNSFDKSYASFFNKCLVLQQEIFNKYNIHLTCRELDTLLVNIANENLKK